MLCQRLFELLPSWHDKIEASSWARQALRVQAASYGIRAVKCERAGAPSLRGLPRQLWVVESTYWFVFIGCRPGAALSSSKLRVAPCR